MKGGQRFGPLVLVVFLLFLVHCGTTDLTERDDEAQRVPLYIRKARELLRRQKAYHSTQQHRMHTLSKALATFARDLYRLHADRHHGNSSHGNVIVSPLGAYASLAMMLTASRGVTKKEVAKALVLSDITGVHHTLQRAFESYQDDDSYEVNNDVSEGVVDAGGGEIGFSENELAEIMRNDYLMDNKISYSAGQTNLMFSDGVVVSESHTHMHGDNAISDADGYKVGASADFVSIRFANGMFHNEDVGLSQRYIMRLASLYGAPPMAMEQSAPEDSVNLWVDAATYGAVSRVLGPGSVDNDTLLVLISGAYFRAAWQEKFDDELIPLGFQTELGDTVVVDSLFHVGNYSVKTLHGVSAKVLELPYTGGRYSLYLILPKTKKVHRGLPALEQYLNTADLCTILDDMPVHSKTLVMIPKFSLNSATSMKTVLQGLGAERMFKPRQAHLGRMTGETKSRLYVSDVFQRVTLHVDDGKSRDDTDGWVSVDATETLLGSSRETDTAETSEPNETGKDYDDYEEDYGDDYFEEYDEGDYDSTTGESEDTGHFIADRPFFFLLKDKQFDLILMMGRVTNPLR